MFNLALFYNYKNRIDFKFFDQPFQLTFNLLYSALQIDEYCATKNEVLDQGIEFKADFDKGSVFTNYPRFTDVTIKTKWIPNQYLDTK